MKKGKDDKPVTLNQLGVTLERFISPIYTRLDRLEGNVGELKKVQAKQGEDINQLKTGVSKLETDMHALKSGFGRLETEVDSMNRIQLRMEHKLDNNIQALYDKSSSHDDKLEDHNQRITKLEKTI